MTDVGTVTDDVGTVIDDVGTVIDDVGTVIDDVGTVIDVTVPSEESFGISLHLNDPTAVHMDRFP